MVDVMDVVESSQSLNKALYKIELFIIKTIPYLLAMFYLLNTTLSYFYIDLPIISYIAGISLLPWLFLYISSFVFKFCIYHRLPLYYILVNWIIVHEAKHVQSHICKFYNIEEDSEEAAYLIGYIVQRMHSVFKNMISTGKK